MHAFKHVVETELAEQYARGTRAWMYKSTLEYIWQFSAAQTRRATAICESAVALEFDFQQLDDRLFMKGICSP